VAEFSHHSARLRRSDHVTEAQRAEARIGLTVNPTIRSLSRWENSDDPLVQSIRANPVVDVGPDIPGTTNDEHERR
jgi:hypothetical protein